MFLLNGDLDLDRSVLDPFTIQNVPIKYRKRIGEYKQCLTLQYKMFLLNYNWKIQKYLNVDFTIQNVPIK